MHADYNICGYDCSAVHAELPLYGMLLLQLSEAVSEVSVEEEELLDEEGSKNGDEDEGSKEGQDEGYKEGQEDESEEEDFPWPDTTIAVAHVSGGRYVGNMLC